METLNSPKNSPHKVFVIKNVWHHKMASYCFTYKKYQPEEDCRVMSINEISQLFQNSEWPALLNKKDGNNAIHILHCRKLNQIKKDW
jgi:hypothetical protein